VGKVSDREGHGADEWLRVAAAAELLGVSHNTLRRWTDEGKVRCRRSPGGQRRFRRGELERLSAAPVASRARLSLLLESSRAAATAATLEEALAIVAQRTAEALSSPECSILEYDAYLDAVIPRAYYERTPSGWDKLGVPFPLSGRPYERSVLADGVPRHEYVSDRRLDAKVRDGLVAWGDVMCLRMPLRIRDESMGFLVLFERRLERRFNAEELALVSGFAEQATAAIHNAQSLRRQEEQSTALASLLDASRAITSSLVLDEVLDTVAHRTVEALGSSYCVIWEYEGGDAIVERGGYETDSDYRVRGTVVDLAARPADRRILMGDGPVLETLSDSGLDPGSRASMEQWGEKTCLSVPLRYQDERLGLLVIGETQRERSFSRAELELVAGLTDQAAIAVHNARLYADLERRNAELAAQARRQALLNDVGRALSSSLVLDEVLHMVTTRAAEALGCPEALLNVYDAEAETLTSRSFYSAAGEPYEWLGEPIAMDEFTTDRELLASGEIVVETLCDPDLPEPVRASLLANGEKTCLSIPLIVGSERLGIMLLIDTVAERVYTADELSFARSLSEHAAQAIHNARLYESVQRLHLGNLRALSSALTAKDYYTIGHTARVAAYAVMLAAELGWSAEAIHALEEATYLHDIGKIAVSDRVLLKPGPLTDEEWLLMKQHPVVSADIIESLLDERHVAGVRHHHERYDGKGYPDGLAGEDIPEIARLMCVVDSYDAMSSRRVYRTALTYPECVAEVERCRGSQFDPAMADAFLRVVARHGESRRALMVAAEEAASLIDGDAHKLLRTSADQERPEYAAVEAALRGVRERHPAVDSLVTEAPRDAQRFRVVVDSDSNAETHVPIGEVAISNDIEVDTFAGRPITSNVVQVDSWGAWLFEAAPIRDSGGAIVGLVAAGMTPAGARGLRTTPSEVGETFAGIVRGAALRDSRAEIDAMTDTLTGLHNHRHLHERLDVDVGVAAQKGLPLSLLFCDIDNFKELNDRHGHLQGDEVLREVANLMATSIRGGDTAARYGGDEFVIVLHGADAAQALEIAERLRARVAGLELGPRGEPTTLSIGIASLPQDGLTKEVLLAAAGVAMYAAKQAGRDCVRAAAGLIEAVTEAVPAD
jgi:diguanylate cyclase (GGDEF)-like protein/excisionase family DNA binding protein